MNDILCPFLGDSRGDPIDEPVPSISTTECQGTEVAKEVVGTKRKTHVCGYCNQTGRRNQMRNGVPLCPKRKDDFQSHD